MASGNSLFALIPHRFTQLGSKLCAKGTRRSAGERQPRIHNPGGLPGDVRCNSSIAHGHSRFPFAHHKGLGPAPKFSATQAKSLDTPPATQFNLSVFHCIPGEPRPFSSPSQHTALTRHCQKHQTTTSGLCHQALRDPG